MPGTSTWKMLTFNWLELTSSTAYRYIEAVFNKESNGI